MARDHTAVHRRRGHRRRFGRLRHARQPGSRSADAVEGEPADYDWLRCAIADLQTRLTEDPSPANILVTTGAAVNAMQDYNRRTSHILSARSVELQSIVGMLTGAMSQIATTSQTSI